MVRFYIDASAQKRNARFLVLSTGGNSEDPRWSVRMSIRSLFLTRRWRIRRKIIAPVAALVVVAIGASALATLYVFNRYTERDVDERLAQWLATILTTNLINPYDRDDYEKVKMAFGADLIGSTAEGNAPIRTLDGWNGLNVEERERLRATLAHAYRVPAQPHTFTALGHSYRMAHERIPSAQGIVLITMMQPLDEVEAARERMALIVGGIALAAIGYVLLMGSWIARAITNPIEELAEGARRVAGGDLSRSVEPMTEDEIGQLAVAFNEMTERLRRSRAELAQQERLATAGQMSATFSHEIRNPLSSIKMMLQLAAEQTREHKTRRYVENTLEEIDRLNEIVEEMLDFARPPKLARGEVKLARTLRGVMDLMAPNFDRQRIEARAHLNDRTTIQGDEDSLKRAFLNILLNAAQAQPDGGEIDVTLTEEQRRARVTVQDRGPGFSDAALEALFRPFFTTKTRGSGLGLASAKRVVEQHDGEMAVENRPDGGARVVMSLPMETNKP